jgi:threonine dehydratase
MIEVPADLTAPLSGLEIADARRRIAGSAIHAPLSKSGDTSIWLKLECLQPYGSYKIRGATNAVKARIEREGHMDAIVSASAGNFGLAIAAAAKQLSLPAFIHVPDNAARIKLESLRALGATIREHSFAAWWRIMQTRETEDCGVFFHPVCEREVMAGAATIGEEIVEDLPDVETIFIPIGGGGLASGIAQAVKRRVPGCRIVAVESEMATPLLAARRQGEPVTVERRACFIDGMGSTRLLDEMWPLFKRLVDDVIVVSVAEIEAAIRLLAARHHVIAEGAGAAAFAAALKMGPGTRAVAIVSGGNIDIRELSRILADAFD